MLRLLKNRCLAAAWLNLVIILITSCNPHPGFEETESGIFKKLDQFGDCEPALNAADYFVAEVKFKSSVRADTGYSFQLHHQSLKKSSSIDKASSPPGLRILQELDSLNCGDQYSFILPFSEIDNSFLSAYADTSFYKSDEEMEFSIHILKTFSDNDYFRFLMNSAQQNEMSEAESIELLLMNDVRFDYEKHGDCFIQWVENHTGDSIKPGREIHIRYTTHLLDQTRLDSLTEMQFSFGKPGQIIGGLQYGLSFLGKHDKARIYLPSYLAFGENGNSNGIIPARTPLFFDVEVLDVR
jgi:FKBP-type peptidyl-prolyl cis-trans isomerase